MARRVLVGTSGFSYPHWRGVIYPPGLLQARWQEHYAARFPRVEMNNPFYRLPSQEQFQAWARRTPSGFGFSVKASRSFSHIRRLQGVEEPVRTFLSRGGALGAKLGPVLFSSRRFLGPDIELLDGFLSALPPGPWHVLELGHPRWHSQAVLGLLRAHGAGLCIHDKAESRCPFVRDGEFAYIRCHGPWQRRPRGARRPQADDPASDHRAS